MLAILAGPRQEGKSFQAARVSANAGFGKLLKIGGRPLKTASSALLSAAIRASAAA
jgi:hypothetical protein